jgi:hypothetical protein
MAVSRSAAICQFFSSYFFRRVSGRRVRRRPRVRGASAGYDEVQCGDQDETGGREMQEVSSRGNQTNKSSFAVIPMFKYQSRSFKITRANSQLQQEEYLVHVAQELASDVLATSLLVVKDSRRGGLKEY